MDTTKPADSPPSEHWLSAAEDAALRSRSNLRGLYLAAHAWALVFGAMAVFVWLPNVLTFLLAVIIIGNRQLGLAILMHDAAHRLLFANPKLNDLAGAYLCGAPVGASLTLYRPYHLSHHRHTQTDNDPDLALSAPFPITRQSFRRKLIRDLFGVTGYQRRAAQLRAAMGEARGAGPRLQAIWRAERAFIVSNLTLLLLLTAAGYAWLYPVLWLLPLLTWYQLISRVRNIAEHAVVGAADDPLRNTRTTLAGPLMRLFVAPYWVNYHLEHHLFVFTPCWKLPLAHKMLRSKGLLPRMEVGASYLEVIRKATSATGGGGRDSRGPRRETFAHL